MSKLDPWDHDPVIVIVFIVIDVALMKTNNITFHHWQNRFITSNLLFFNQYIILCIDTGTFKNQSQLYTYMSSNYTDIRVTTNTFFKSWISKICNGFSLYIYHLEFNWIWILWFLHPINNSFATKIRKLDRTCDAKLNINWNAI